MSADFVLQLSCAMSLLVFQCGCSEFPLKASDREPIWSNAQASQMRESLLESNRLQAASNVKLDNQTLEIQAIKTSAAANVDQLETVLDQIGTLIEEVQSLRSRLDVIGMIRPEATGASVIADQGIVEDGKVAQLYVGGKGGEVASGGSRDRLVMLTANWCGFCRQFEGEELPKIKAAGISVSGSENAQVQIIHCDEPEDLPKWAAPYAGRLPTFLLASGDQVKRSLVGMSTFQNLQAFAPEVFAGRQEAAHAPVPAASPAVKSQQAPSRNIQSQSHPRFRLHIFRRCR